MCCPVLPYVLDATVEHSFETKYYMVWSIPNEVCGHASACGHAQACGHASACGHAQACGHAPSSTKWVDRIATCDTVSTIRRRRKYYWVQISAQHHTLLFIYFIYPHRWLSKSKCRLIVSTHDSNTLPYVYM